jgi:hypothetical protein
MLRANWLMYVPRRLKNCPDHMTAKRRIPVSRSPSPVLSGAIKMIILFMYNNLTEKLGVR